MNTLHEEFLTPTPPAPFLNDFINQTVTRIDPDNPSWSVGSAALVWIGSVVLLFATQLVAIVAYFFISVRPLTQQTAQEFLKQSATNPTLLLIAVASVIPAHLLTLAIVWLLVTEFGKRPFWASLGWSWSANFGFWKSASLAVSLLVLGGIIQHYLGGDAETDIDKIVASSTAARITIALLATATAPIVEELIYRGVLYPALQRTMGVVASILIVSALFASVHVAQYRNNIGVIIAVAILSLTLTLVRAYTKSLLPCFMIHFVFNGIQSIAILFAPQFEKWDNARHAKPALNVLAHEFVKFLS
ncbi:MAG: type II CAAX endopeptidase family protein [Pyrinomonadaceae bacterium]